METLNLAKLSRLASQHLSPEYLLRTGLGLGPQSAFMPWQEFEGGKWHGALAPRGGVGQVLVPSKEDPVRRLGCSVLRSISKERTI